MSFGLLFIFIVLVFWRPQEWLFPWLFGIPMLDAVTYGAILSLFLEFDSGAVRIERREPQYMLYAGLFFAGLMSHLSHGYMAGLLDSWTILFRLCFFGILLFSCCTTVPRLRWICRAFVVLALLMAIHSILQAVRGYGFAGQRPILSLRPNIAVPVPRSRFFGIFDDPNDLAQFLATSIPLCFVFVRTSGLLPMAFAVGATWVLWLGIDATWSRGANIGLLATGATALVMLLFKRTYRTMLVIGMLAALMAIPFSGRFLGDAWERVDLWGQANWAFKAHPVFGVGMGMLNEYLQKDKVAHNAFVHCYAELGVFGFFFWIALIFLAFIGLLQTRRALRDCEEPEGQWLYRFSAWGLAALAGFTASAYFLSRAYTFPLFFLTAMLGAVPILARQYAPADRPDDMRLGLTGRDTCILGIPLSCGVIAYVYVSILILNMQR
jgi:putative inorganic carbon (hco3(-)) transporter